MDFLEWEPLYESILADFGYSRERDMLSAKILSKLRPTDSLRPLKNLKNKTVEIAGPFFSESCSEITIAAGSAVEQLFEKGVEPDIMVTDLDGDKDLQLELNLKDIPIVIHSHGDNIDLLKRWAKRFKGPVISTCQCKPPSKDIHNFGGFTDGDRACFIAEHFGVEKIVLNGWDFDKPFSGKNSVKKKKLNWAKKLIQDLDVPIEVL